ncbi:MAG: N-acetyl-gamma-glutamyl-phosphate reductase [Terriglobales bacterium]
MNNYSKARVAIAGASGYAGRELQRLLARHGGAAVVAAQDSSAGVETLAAANAELVFLATPAEVSAAWVPVLQALPAPPRIVDLSAAFRFDERAVYGWPERNAGAIRGAALVANPGCYATAVNLALGPLLRAGAIAPEEIICDAKSGASGAGRGLRPDLHFCELEGNCKAYSVYAHGHAPEIARHAGLDAASFTFTPHLLPTARGILATHYVRCRGGDLEPAYRQAYQSQPFVRLRGAELPELHDVVHTNFCDIGWRIRGDRQQAVIVSCLDNLVKGAAGQALQNANLMMGWEETEGLV